MFSGGSESQDGHRSGSEFLLSGDLKCRVDPFSDDHVAFHLSHAVSAPTCRTTVFPGSERQPSTSSSRKSRSEVSDVSDSSSVLVKPVVPVAGRR